MGERKRSLSQSLLYTACYSGLAFLFGVGLYIYGGKQKALGQSSQSSVSKSVGQSVSQLETVSQSGRSQTFRPAGGWVHYYFQPLHKDTPSVDYSHRSMHFSWRVVVRPEFAAAYLVEQSLSVDNLFVFLITFKYFLVPPELQPRVLTWGIIGAVLMRGVMIVAGVSAVQRFKSIILIFAAILLVSAVKLFFENDEPEELSNNMILRISKRVVGAVDVSARLPACLPVRLTD